MAEIVTDDLDAGLREGLVAALEMLERWMPEAFPAILNGEVDLARGLADAALDAIRALLTPSAEDAGVLIARIEAFLAVDHPAHPMPSHARQLLVGAVVALKARGG